jgi:hypothetical protein
MMIASSGQRLAVHTQRFPTSKHDYTLETPMMKDACDIVSAEVDKMEIGVSICGTSRFGKTRMMEYLEREILKQSPSVTSALVIMTSPSLNTDKKFFAHILTSVNAEDELIGNGDELRTRIEQFFLVQCSERQDPRLLLMIDEAQRMTPMNFSYLIDLTNHLERHGMAPTVLLVGQPELLDTRDTLLKQKRKDAVGRFLDNPIVFEGVCSGETLRPILRQYDDYTKAAYPEGSQVCITAAYVRDLYAKGFRLENATDALWAAFKSSARDLRTKPVVGMRNLTRAVEMGLTELAISGRAEDAISKRWWKQILLESGYLRHLKTISDSRAT